ncbi:rho guanine nucleotide exchange factor 16 [Poecilia reticulata]|uniref:Rho guanine nucleotide exchange factor (GEF) 16 n=1 Tax=Poecilia reticulata TaxID=8081 RepID=A0A3P9PU19_POERE|nr:PREDICTED: rho guanine nucleotide exchange factor 16 [Poecilia reticulata]XP_008411715.1 PREDICTED: rho guanine nucleotide exchange factor 16 [Poecilia reticulata]XP_008411717.1 PREDICTED: rho guanine nucleotide exchange factor 16 [Poecilia reticulata]
MSHSESDKCTDNKSPQIETLFSTELHIYEPGDEGYQPKSPPTLQSETATPQEDEVDKLVVPEQVILSTETPAAQKPETQKVILSTESPAAKKLGTHQLIPKSLAVSSRPKNRHHTTVVTFPVGLENSNSENRSRHSAQGPDVSRDDYDSDGDGFRRNRRNKSYRAAVTSLDIDAMTSGTAPKPTLKSVNENRESSPGPSLSSKHKRSLGRKRNQRGSFKDATPCLYQEIRERGLDSTQQDELLEDFVVVEPPAEDHSIVMKSYKQAHLTWSQLPQVQESGILSTITPQERKRQEAIFEIITSEHSYLHSLGILVRHFKSSAALKKTMTTTEHHHLFSNISVIHTTSQRFFKDLEKRHNEQMVIRDISDIVQNHAAHHFEPYIVYCSNETFQQRTLQKLLNNNSAFKDTLKEIERNSECGGLPMLSFLILPMQRVTRLPLLLDTICQKTQDQTAEYFAAVWSLKAMSKLVTECNDGARRMERTEQMYTIQKQMDFGKIKPFPLVSASRWLKKRGELAVSSEELSIWRAFTNRSYYLFLFNDVLIVTKKKSEESFVVLDYATLDNVQVEFGEDADVRTSPSKGNSNYLSFKLRMSKNSEGKLEQISLVADSRVDRARWITALKEQKQEGVFTCTDGMPQYEVTKTYMPKDPDELGLRQAEVVIVLQKEEEWRYGERMRDGERGWFPANCATEITDPTAMESNMQRMKRLRKETNV